MSYRVQGGGFISSPSAQIQPSTTPLQVLRTNAAATATEWATLSTTGSMVLMDYGVGNTTQDPSEVVFTKTFATNDFDATDQLIVVVDVENATNNARLNCKITDGASSVTINAFQTLVVPMCSAIFTASVSQVATTKAVTSKCTNEASNAPTSQLGTLASANWITTAFTLEVIGGVSGGGTSYYRVWVYKRTG